MGVDDYAGLFEQAGRQYNVDPRLLRAVASQESSGNPNAIGVPTKSGRAKGLMQLTDETARGLGVTDPLDPKQAVPAAARLLAQHLDQFGNVNDALRAYYASSDKKQWGPKTEAYVSDVARRYGVSGQSQAVSADDDILNQFVGAPAKTSAARQAPSDDDLLNQFVGKTSITPKPAAKSNAAQKFVLNKEDRMSAGRTANVFDMPLFGFSDELMGAGGAARMGLNQLLSGKGVTLGKNYSDAVSAVRQGQQEYSTANIGNDMRTDLPGVVLSLGTGGIVAKPVSAGFRALRTLLPAAGTAAAKKILPRAAQFGTRIAEGATMGGTMGGLYGAGSADNGDRLGGAANGAETGAAVGGSLPILFDLGRATGGAIRNIAAPFTEGGRQRIAQQAVENYAGGPVNLRTNEIVPGSVPTMAEAAFPPNAGVAALQRTMRDLSQNSPLVAREGEQAAARNRLFDDTAGTPQDIESAAKARDTLAARARSKIFATAQPVNAAPVVKAIDDILSGSSGKRPAVAKAMSEVRNILLDANGKPTSSPEVLYDSVRKGIGDLIDGKDLTKAYGKTAAQQLIAVRDVLDQTMDDSTGGAFGQYLAAYAQQSAPINAMEFLQSQNLADVKGNITLAKVQGALRRLTQQQGKAGVQKAKSVTTDQMKALQAIRDDLLRGQTINLGRSLGSNTAQNLGSQQLLQNMLPGRAGAFAGHLPGTLTGGGVGGAIGTAVGGPFVGGPIGAMIGGGLTRMTNNAVQQHVENMLLNPSAYEEVANKTSRSLAVRSARDKALRRLTKPDLAPIFILPQGRITNRLLAPQSNEQSQ